MMSDEDLLMPDLEQLTNMGYKLFREALDEFMFGLMPLAADAYRCANDLICEAEGVANPGELPRGCKYERYILQIKIAWLPAMRLSAFYSLPHEKHPPAVKEVKQFIDDPKGGYNHVQLLCWDLTKAAEYGSLLELLEYVREKK